MKKLFPIIFLVAGCSQAAKPVPPETAQPADAPRLVCTQDAMQCPDGSWVGRTGPKCEFICPQSQEK